MNFGTHPINLLLRLILELTTLFAAGYWGWSKHTGLLQYLLAAGLPILLAVLWGVFAVPGDPSRSGKTVVATPGFIRLIIELAVFAAGGWFLYHSGLKIFSMLFIGLFITHYIFSIDRLRWLLIGKKK